MTKITNLNTVEELPLIALKHVVLFPKVVTPLVVQRTKSVAGLEDALAKNGRVIFVAQKNLKDDTETKDLFEIGTVGKIVSANRLADGSFKVDIEGLSRVKISTRGC